MARHPADQQTGFSHRNLDRESDEFAANRDKLGLFQQGPGIGDVYQESTPLLPESRAKTLKIGDHSIGATPFVPLGSTGSHPTMDRPDRPLD